MADRFKASPAELGRVGEVFDAEVNKQFADDPELLEQYHWLEWFADLRSALPRVRKSANLSQTELAKRTGTDQGEISRLENSAREGVSLGRLRRFVEACGGRIAVTIWDAEGKVVLDQADRMVDRFELTPEARDEARGLDRLAELMSDSDEFLKRVAREMAKLAEH